MTRSSKKSFKTKEHQRKDRPPSTETKKRKLKGILETPGSTEEEAYETDYNDRPLCRSYPRGKCTRGIKCEFEHLEMPEYREERQQERYEDKISEQPILYSHTCPQFNKGKCRLGNAYPMKHLDPKIHRGQAKANIPCKFISRGFCGNGDDCPYSHMEQQENPEVQYEPEEDYEEDEAIMTNEQYAKPQDQAATAYHEKMPGQRVLTTHTTNAMDERHLQMLQSMTEAHLNTRVERQERQEYSADHSREQLKGYERRSEQQASSSWERPQVYEYQQAPSTIREWRQKYERQQAQQANAHREGTQGYGQQQYQQARSSWEWSSKPNNTQERQPPQQANSEWDWPWN